MTRRDLLSNALKSLCALPLLGVRGKDIERTLNVWWEVILPWTPPQPGLGKSGGSIRFWKEGVPGHVFIPAQYIPTWLTPKDLAEAFASHDGKTDFVRIRNADNSECFDFYCVPQMQDELVRGSLHESNWNCKAAHSDRGK